MVKKSLAKIGANTASGSTDSGSNLDSVGSAVSILANSMVDVSSQIASLSGALASASARLAAIETLSLTVATNTGNTDMIVSIVPETLSSEDTTALSMILGTAENLIIQGKTLFQETVTFAQTVIFEKAVIFRSLVTFEDRVIFGDKDMGGSAHIGVGSRSTHISFDRPYAEVPVITITPVDHYISAKVTHLSTSGFDIEVVNSASQNLRFTWMAVLVK